MEYTFLTKEVADLIGNNLSSSDYETNKLSIINQIDSLLTTIRTSYLDKKYTIEEITDLIKEISITISHIVKISNNLTKEQFKQLILEIIKKIYFNPEGLNNPSLTFLPNFIEDKVEKQIFNVIIPRITEEIYNKLKE